MLFEVLLEQMFSFIASKGIDQLETLRTQLTNQNILYLTITQFAKSELFRTEYKDTIYIDNKDDILAIAHDSIAPTLSISEIVENLTPLLEKCFITDDKTVSQRLFESIAMQYLAKNNLAVSMLDIAKQQRESTDAIVNSVSGLQSELENISAAVAAFNTKKERALNSGLGLKINSFIFTATQHFVLIATKNSPVLSGSDKTPRDSILELMKTIRDLVLEDFPVVDERYFITPIKTFTPDPHVAFQTNDLHIDVLKMLYIYKTELNNKVDELLKYSNLLPDNFLIAMMDVMRVLESSPLLMVYTSGMAEIFKVAVSSEDGGVAKSVKGFYIQLADKILELEKYVY